MGMATQPEHTLWNKHPSICKTQCLCWWWFDSNRQIGQVIITLLKNSKYETCKTPEHFYGNQRVNHHDSRSESCFIHTSNDKLWDSLLYLNVVAIPEPFCVTESINSTLFRLHIPSFSVSAPLFLLLSSIQM